MFVGPWAREAGRSAPAPVAIVLHGNFDRPEWECAEWDRMVMGRAWILCPRGVPRAGAPPELDRWTYVSRKAARAEMDAALGALGAAYPGRVAADGPFLYGGFSLGAIYGEAIVRAETARFPRAVLIEGGLSGWSAASAAAFVKKGGRGVLFGCGSKACGKRAEGKAALLRAAGAYAAVVTIPTMGHGYGGELPVVARPSLAALVAGAAGW
jgi:predicted esterase